MFLSKDDLQALTGYKRPGAQRRFLRARGIPHDINGRQGILVLRSVVESMMGSKQKSEETPEPNWGAMYGTKKAS